MFFMGFSMMREISFVFGKRTANRAGIRAVFAVMAFALVAGAQQPATPILHPAKKDLSVGTPVLLDAMTTELNRAFTSLGKQGDAKQLPPYFLSYSVSDASAVTIEIGRAHV